MCHLDLIFVSFPVFLFPGIILKVNQSFNNIKIIYFEENKWELNQNGRHEIVVLPITLNI